MRVTRRLFLAVMPGAVVLGRPAGSCVNVEPTSVAGLVRAMGGPYLTVNEARALEDSESLEESLEDFRRRPRFEGPYLPETKANRERTGGEDE